MRDLVARLIDYLAVKVMVNFAFIVYFLKADHLLLVYHSIRSGIALLGRRNCSKRELSVGKVHAKQFFQ